MSIYVYKVYSDFHTFARNIYSFTRGNGNVMCRFGSLARAEFERERMKKAGTYVSSIKFTRLTWDVKNGEENDTEKAALELFNN